MPAPAALFGPPGKKLRLAEYGQTGPGQDQALLNGQHGDAEFNIAQKKFRPALDPRGPFARLEQFHDRLAPALALGRDQYPTVKFGQKAPHQPERRRRARVDGQAGGHGRVIFNGLQAGIRAGPADPEPGKLSPSGRKLSAIQKQRPWRQQWPLGLVTPLFITRLDIGLERFSGLIHVFIQRQHGLGAQIIEQAAGPLVKQWQIIFDPGRGQGLTHIAVNRALPGVALKPRAPVAAKAGDTLGVQRDLARGQDPDRPDLCNRTLGLDVKSPNTVDLVIQQINAVGPPGAHRENIKQRAAPADLAMLRDLLDKTVALALQAVFEPFKLKRLPDLQQQAVCAQIIGRQQPLHDRCHRRHKDAAPEPGQGRKRL